MTKLFKVGHLLENMRQQIFSNETDPDFCYCLNAASASQVKPDKAQFARGIAEAIQYLLLRMCPVLDVSTISTGKDACLRSSFCYLLLMPVVVDAWRVLLLLHVADEALVASQVK